MSKVWDIAELGVTMSALPKERVVAAQKMCYLPSGRIMVLGSKGQVYVDWSGAKPPSRVTPCQSSLSAAVGLRRLGVISEADFKHYSSLCRKTIDRGSKRDSVYQLTSAAAELGVTLTKKQQAKLDGIEAGNG